MPTNLDPIGDASIIKPAATASAAPAAPSLESHDPLRFKLILEIVKRLLWPDWRFHFALAARRSEGKS